MSLCGNGLTDTHITKYRNLPLEKISKRTVKYNSKRQSMSNALKRGLNAFARNIDLCHPAQADMCRNLSL